MERILKYLNGNHRREISGLKNNFLESCIKRRMEEKNLSQVDSYYEYLQKNEQELEQLVSSLTIPVSRFFRNPIIFEMIFHYLLPSLVEKKRNDRQVHLRFWSAGCSSGEEPYSLAILSSELSKKENFDFHIEIFATDIDEKTLQIAKAGSYEYESVKNTRYEWVQNYFKREGELYSITSELKNMVSFSRHDLRNEKSIVPPESIFGHFDLVFCRNLLIYYELEAQKKILNNLLNSLIPEGFLVLGESEQLLPEYRLSTKKIFQYTNIYKKTGY